MLFFIGRIYHCQGTHHTQTHKTDAQAINQKKKVSFTDEWDRLSKFTVKAMALVSIHVLYMNMQHYKGRLPYL